MSDVLTAMAQHTADVGRLYLQNAILDRGVPNDPGRIVIDSLLPPQPEPAPAPPPTPPTPATPTTPGSGVVVLPTTSTRGNPLSGVLSSLLPLALATMGGSLGTFALSHFLSPKNSGPSETVIVKPVVTPTVPKDGSLLQYLEDKGYHLPPDKRPK